MFTGYPSTKRAVPSAAFLTLRGERSTNQLGVALDCCLAGFTRVYLGGVKWLGIKPDWNLNFFLLEFDDVRSIKLWFIYLTFMLYIWLTTETNCDFKPCLFYFSMLLIEACYWEVLVGNSCLRHMHFQKYKQGLLVALVAILLMKAIFKYQFYG